MKKIIILICLIFLLGCPNKSKNRNPVGPQINISSENEKVEVALLSAENDPESDDEEITIDFSDVEESCILLDGRDYDSVRANINTIYGCYNNPPKAMPTIYEYFRSIEPVAWEGRLTNCHVLSDYLSLTIAVENDIGKKAVVGFSYKRHDTAKNEIVNRARGLCDAKSLISFTFKFNSAAKSSFTERLISLEGR